MPFTKQDAEKHFEHLKKALKNNKYVYYKRSDGVMIPIDSFLAVENNYYSGNSIPHHVMVYYKNTRRYGHSNRYNYNATNNTYSCIDFQKDFEIRDKQIRKKPSRTAKKRQDTMTQEEAKGIVDLYNNSKYILVCYKREGFEPKDESVVTLATRYATVDIDPPRPRMLGFKKTKSGKITHITGLGPQGGSVSLKEISIQKNFRFVSLRKEEIDFGDRVTDNYQLF